MVVFLCIMNRLKLFGMMTKHFNAFFHLSFLVMFTYPDMLYLYFISNPFQFIRASDYQIQVKIQLRSLIRPQHRLAVLKHRNQSDYIVISAKSLINMTQMIVPHKKVTEETMPLKMINGTRIHTMTMMRPSEKLLFTTKQSFKFTPKPMSLNTYRKIIDALYIIPILFPRLFFGGGLLAQHASF